MDANLPVAAQISQADIIERQAETIARLKQKLQKWTHYKQLTKIKLKEAASRLKEYRLRVETLLLEVETLRTRLKAESTNADNLKNRLNTVKNVKATKRVLTAATQTQDVPQVPPQYETLVHGQLKDTTTNRRVDHEVQTRDSLKLDTSFSKKRRRKQNVAMCHAPSVLNQVIPKVSRHSHPDTVADTVLLHHEPLDMIKSMTETTSATIFIQESSAALDAALAMSDTEEIHEVTDAVSKPKDDNGHGEEERRLRPTTLDKVKKKKESCDEDEVHADGAVDGNENDHFLLRRDGEDQVILDDMKRGSSSEKHNSRRQRVALYTANNGDCRQNGRGFRHADKKQANVSVDFDFAISNAIDKDLESSSDEENEVNVKDVTNTNRAERFNVVRQDVGDSMQSKPTLISIDDVLDDEFAAMNTDSDGENDTKADKFNLSGSSSKCDLSGSKSSNDGDEVVANGVDHIAENTSMGTVEVKNDGETAVQQAKSDCKPGILSSLPIDEDAAALVEKTESVSVLKDASMLDAEVTRQSPKQMHVNTCAEALVHTTEKDAHSVTVDSQPNYVEENICRSVKPSSDVIDNIGKPQGCDSQISSGDTRAPNVQVPKPSDLTSFGSANRLSGLKLGPTLDFKQHLDYASLDLPVASIDSSEQNAEAGCADQQLSSMMPMTRASNIGNSRKAEDANLSQTALHKKIKLNDASGQANAETGTVISPTKSTTAKKKKNETKSAVTDETKEKLRLLKSLSTFKRAIVLGKGERPDHEYTRRTIALLVKQSSKFVGTHIDHVKGLCRALADAYRLLGVASMLVVRGSLSIFGAPRTRRLLQKSKMGLSWLCNQVLIRVLCSDTEKLDQDGSPVSLCLSMVDECLLHLQSLLVKKRTNIGENLSIDKEQVQVVTRQVSFRHDKVFLGHVCSLHTHLCRTTGQLARSRAMLFDLLRDNPNISGLYFAMLMLNIYPAILEHEFDQHCNERQVVLRETLQQALVIITGVAAAQQKLLLCQSSITMLHAIADALQMTELENVDGSDLSFQRTCVENLFHKVVVLCQSSSSRIDEVHSLISADYFALVKSMEICTAVCGVGLVMDVVNVERCRELFCTANVENKIGIMHVIGHIASSCNVLTMSDLHPMRTTCEEYIKSVTDWMCRILMSDEKSLPEDDYRLRVGCSTVCVEVVLASSFPSGLDSRRRLLYEVVRWFDAMPSDQQISLPATFLRRLRLAVVAARPQVNLTMASDI